MTEFNCTVPFEAGTTWVRRNFFSLEMKPIGDSPEILSARTDGLPAIKTCEVRKTSTESGWGDQTPVIEVYIALQSPAPAPGAAIVLIEADIEGELKACSEVADACNGGSSG
jgi:hypothetical protein